MSSDTLLPVVLPEPHEFTQNETWTERFRRLGLAGLTTTAREVLEADATFIVNECIVAPGTLNAWDPEIRVRAGIVVGAVQSGKTASMLAVSARLLDRGVNIVVVLAGTRIALWKQTLDRLLRQLDGTTAKTRRTRRSRRFFLPDPDAVLGVERATPREYAAQGARSLFRALREGKPVIVVIPKQDDHLIAVCESLQGAINEAIEQGHERRLHMVVLDDEADDASVLDAEKSKIVPHRIQALWAKRRAHTGATFRRELYATYVAYTATPQANFLQFEANPLSPRSFCAALRVPWSWGGEPRQTRQPTFTEPAGIRSFYFGGEAWYVPPPSLTVSSPFPAVAEFDSEEKHAKAVEEESHRMVDEAIRAFLVAAALSDLGSENGGRLSICSIAAELSLAECALLPEPVGMLIHPASSMDRQWAEAERIWKQANGTNGGVAPSEGELTINGAGWLFDLEQNSCDWARWHEAYVSTQSQLRNMPGGAELQHLTAPDWQTVRRRIQDLIPLVQLRVINSDEKADDRPQYAPTPIQGAADCWRAPADLLTIFVSGNVMSRGITLEGLTTSVFTRASGTPAADTQMQMQRWFGYRGSRAPLLRMFTFTDQLELFRDYHGYDTAMRREICSSMQDGSFSSPEVVLQGSVALATAKVPTRRLPLCPGATPSVRILEVEDQVHQSENLQRVGELLETKSWSPISVNGLRRGLICDVPWSMVEAAEFLESLRYRFHDPSADDDERYSRWAALGKQLDLAPEEAPLLRAPGIKPSRSRISVRACPYTIAAYLRLWAAALRRNNIDGMSTTLPGAGSWSLDRFKLPNDVPVQVGLRFGERPEIDGSILGLKGVHPVERKASRHNGVELNTLWGSRGKEGDYLGDQRFDYHRPEAPPPPPLHSGGAFWRPADHPILMLIHIVQATVDGDGKHYGLGVAVGMSFPLGGPEQFAALRRADS